MPEGLNMPGTIGVERVQQAERMSLDERLRRVEASLIGWALKMSQGNKSKAARLLQIKRSTLGDRINRCGLGPQTE
jgi:DNA-binding NtrC family response regulator